MVESHHPVLVKLTRWHLAAAIFMTIQVAAFIAIPLSTTIPQTVGFPNRATQRGPVSAPSVTAVYDLSVKGLIIAFVALAAIDHWICALIGFCKPATFDKYVHDYQANPFRWIEYSVSASLMSVLLAGLCGIYDIHLLFLIGCLTGICNLTGLVVEFMPKSEKKTAFGVYMIGWIALIVSWLPPLCYFFKAVKTGNIPGFVVAAYALTAVCYIAFGLNYHLHWFSGKYDFAKSEIIYIVLSFTAKSFLAWDVFGGYRAAGSS